MPESRVRGDRYQVTDEERERFERDGWVHLRGVVTEDELRGLEEVYQRFLRREISVPGKDFCDMSAEYGRPIEEFAIINVMLPGRYHPPLRGNVYERRAHHIAEQLRGADMVLDYDQLLAKPPGHPDAIFHWHQDLAYWPETTDPRTASFWLALDDADHENGSVRFVSGSHHEPRLRPHHPLRGDRERSHTMVTDVDEAREPVVQARVARGDVTVHHERVVHGSGGNPSARWRRAWVIAYRSRATVEAERALGFTHSHEDARAVVDAIGERKHTRD